MDYSTSLKTLASIMGLVDVLYWIQACWYQHHHHHHRRRHHYISSSHRAMRGDRCDIEVAVTSAYIRQQQQQQQQQNNNNLL